MKFNLPNILTIIRLILVPCMGVCMYKDMYIPAAVMFFVAGVTDVVDGYIARKFNQESELGKILDPLADKLTLLAVGICLCVIEPFFLPVVIILVLKVFIVLVGTSLNFL